MRRLVRAGGAHARIREEPDRGARKSDKKGRMSRDDELHVSPGLALAHHRHEFELPLGREGRLRLVDQIEAALAEAEAELEEGEKRLSVAALMEAAPAPARRAGKKLLAITLPHAMAEVQEPPRPKRKPPPP